MRWFAVSEKELIWGKGFLVKGIWYYPLTETMTLRNVNFLTDYNNQVVLKYLDEQILLNS